MQVHAILRRVNGWILADISKKRSAIILSIVEDQSPLRYYAGSTGKKLPHILKGSSDYLDSTTLKGSSDYLDSNTLKGRSDYLDSTTLKGSSDYLDSTTLKGSSDYLDSKTLKARYLSNVRNYSPVDIVQFREHLNIHQYRCKNLKPKTSHLTYPSFTFYQAWPSVSCEFILDNGFNVSDDYVSIPCMV
jgi:hypothetical protein